MSRRWLRFAGPLAVVVALTAGTLIVHSVEQAEPTDPAYLSPGNTSAIGGSKLADRLAARGVAIQRVTSTEEALAAARTDDEATIFVPAPDLVNIDYLTVLGVTRSVLVAPGPITVWSAGLHADVGGPRWAAATAEPGCAQSWAAGAAAVLRRRYLPTDEGRAICYGGGVLETDRNGPPVMLVGAADPFRNDRIGEHFNEAVAVGLLSRTQKVVWLDLHHREVPPPAPSPSPGGHTTAPAQQQAPGSDHDGPPPSASNEPSITDAFPPAFWAVVLLLALAAIALAVAAGRRLGAPVAEPLPVRVRAAETVRGLGGLYRRARADHNSLATIQAAARRRITEHLGLPPDAPIGDHIPGVPPHVAERLLDDPEQDLATTAEAVQNLVRHVRGNVS